MVGVALAMVLAHLLGASILSSVLPISLVLVGLVRYPEPSLAYLVGMSRYVEAMIMIKLVFQLPLFCIKVFRDVESTSTRIGYAFNTADTSCPPLLASSYSKRLSLPWVIGVVKSNETVFLAHVAIDLVVLVVLYIHMWIIRRKGLDKEEDEREEEGEVEEQEEASDSGSGSGSDSGSGSGSDSGSGSGKVAQIKAMVAEIKSQIMGFVEGVYAEKAAEVDTYMATFGTDLASFVFTIFIWGAFRKDDGKSTNFVQFLFANQIPVTFIVVLLAQFILILAYRAVYLKQWLTGALVYACGVTIGLHVFLFLYVPQTTAKPFTASGALVVFYILRMVSLVLVAIQIRYGFPRYTSGQALTQKASKMGGYVFSAYLALPFVYELRVLLDWMCTPTTLLFYQWLQVEDVFSSVFLVKCRLLSEAATERSRGEARPAAVKLSTGCVLLVFMVIILWLPLFIFSSANPALAANPVERVSVSIQLDALAPLYEAMVSTETGDLAVVREVQPLVGGATNFTRTVEASSGLLSESLFRKDAVQVASLPVISQRAWPVPRALAAQAAADLAAAGRGERVARLVVRMRVERVKEQEHRVVAANYGRELSQAEAGELGMMLGNASRGARLSTDSLLEAGWNVTGLGIGLTKVLPRIVVLGAPASPLSGSGATTIPLEIGALSLSDGSVQWFVSQRSEAGMWDAVRGSGARPMIFVYSNELPDTVLAVLGGLIGVYVGVVLAIGRMLRSYVSGVAHSIMFNHLEPNPDPILTLCRDMAVARQSKAGLRLEEDLYGELVELYRSPEALIARTKGEMAAMAELTREQSQAAAARAREARVRARERVRDRARARAKEQEEEKMKLE